MYDDWFPRETLDREVTQIIVCHTWLQMNKLKIEDLHKHLNIEK